MAEDSDETKLKVIDASEILDKIQKGEDIEFRITPLNTMLSKSFWKLMSIHSIGMPPINDLFLCYQ